MSKSTSPAFVLAASKISDASIRPMSASRTGQARFAEIVATAIVVKLDAGDGLAPCSLEAEIQPSGSCIEAYHAQITHPLPRFFARTPP